MTAAGLDSDWDFRILAHNLDTRALDMFDAFVRTLRAKVKKMRQAITKHYCVNISNLTQTGRRTINNILRDIIKLIYLHCCANSCVAYTSRLLAAAYCLSCRKQQYNFNRELSYLF